MGERNPPSILFRREEDAKRAEGAEQPPACFRDLNLDRVVGAVTASFQKYRLEPYFHTRLGDLDSVAYRQEVVRDLENPTALEVIRSFSGRMRAVREHSGQARKRHSKQQGERWFLGSAEIYCEAVEQLGADLGGLDLASRGMQAIRDYLAGYLASERFVRLAEDVRRIRADLSAIHYTLLLQGDAVLVRDHAGEADYGAAVERTFERFRRRATKDYLATFRDWPDMNHVEAQILEKVALLNPSAFQALEAFSVEHAGFLDDGVSRFDREVQFYVAYLGYVDGLRRAGLPFCLPRVSDRKEVSALETFDVALAAELVAEKKPVVRNDFSLRGRERILVVTGPNQGGKTTFSRTFGQLHYLAGLGCPVPGAEARLLLCDQVFTHFEREEDAANLRGKLHDDLVRMRQILEAATPDSVVVMNEIFSSTTLQDAVFLGRRVLATLSRLDVLAVCVTFLAELASFDDKTVSAVGSVDPQDPTVRTFKVVRRPAEGLAYALALAEKHRVTYEWLARRIRP